MFVRPLLVAGMLAAWCATALAQTPSAEVAPDCSKLSPYLNKIIADWSRPVGGDKVLVGSKDEVALSLDTKTRIKLVPVEELRLARRPLQEDMVKGYAGLAKFRTGKAGHYRFSSTPYVWIELVSEPAGPPPEVIDSDKRLLYCGGVHKNVAFELAADTVYWYQVTAAPQADLDVLITTPR